jgi:AraC-like DNA-binding protein
VQYAEIAPGSRLRQYVKTFWTLQGSGASAPAQRILPDGCFEVVFHFAEAFEHQSQRQPAAMMIGEIRRPVVVQPASVIDVLGIRFRVAGIAAFLKQPAAELRDQILPLDDVWRGLGDWLLNTPRDLRIVRLEEWLLRRLRPLDLMPFEAVSHIRRSGGVVTVRQLASLIGSTERTLERAFHRTVGLPPKTFARLVRFRTWLTGGDNHYYDDPHLCHEFRAFAGVSPTEFRRETNALNDAFVAGEAAV